MGVSVPLVYRLLVYRFRSEHEPRLQRVHTGRPRAACQGGRRHRRHGLAVNRHGRARPLHAVDGAGVRRRRHALHPCRRRASGCVPPRAGRPSHGSRSAVHGLHGDRRATGQRRRGNKPRRYDVEGIQGCRMPAADTFRLPFVPARPLAGIGWRAQLGDRASAGFRC